MQLSTAPPTQRLTPRQMQILQSIASSQASRYYSPTIAELADELGMKQVSRTARRRLLEWKDRKLNYGKKAEKDKNIVTGIAVLVRLRRSRMGLLKRTLEPLFLGFMVLAEAFMPVTSVDYPKCS